MDISPAELFHLIGSQHVQILKLQQEILALTQKVKELEKNGSSD